MAEQEHAPASQGADPSTGRRTASERTPPLDPDTLARDLKLELDMLRTWEESGGPALDVVWDTLRSGTPAPRDPASGPAEGGPPETDRLARARAVRQRQKAAEGTAADPLVRARGAAARLRNLAR